MPQTKRQLIKVPESHVNNQHKNCARLAKALDKRFGVVKLFLEGVLRDKTAEKEKEVGFPVVSIEHADLHASSLIVGFLNAVSVVNSLLWFSKHPSDDRSAEFLLTSLGSLHILGDLESGEGVRATPEAIVASKIRDMRYIASAVTLSGVSGSEYVETIIGQVARVGGEGIVPVLHELIRAGHAELARLDLERKVRELVPELQDSFRELGVDLTLPSSPENLDLDRMLRLLDLNDPVSLFKGLTVLFMKIDLFRELQMVRCVAVEEFDVGVFNTGAKHVYSKTLNGLLPKLDMDIRVVRPNELEAEIAKHS